MGSSGNVAHNILMTIIIAFTALFLGFLFFNKNYPKSPELEALKKKLVRVDSRIDKINFVEANSSYTEDNEIFLCASVMKTDTFMI